MKLFFKSEMPPGLRNAPDAPHISHHLHSSFTIFIIFARSLLVVSQHLYQSVYRTSIKATELLPSINSTQADSFACGKDHSTEHLAAGLAPQCRFLHHRKPFIGPIEFNALIDESRWHGSPSQTMKCLPKGINVHKVCVITQENTVESRSKDWLV